MRTVTGIRVMFREKTDNKMGNMILLRKSVVMAFLVYEVVTNCQICKEKVLDLSGKKKQL